jgi:hypothetical protein
MSPSDPFRSMASTLQGWPKVEGELREIGFFARCSMCQRSIEAGDKVELNWTTVYYNHKPVCFEHALELPELRRKARYANAALAQTRERGDDEPAD